MKILLTSTSFQDTPGAHQELLLKFNIEVDRMRGPLKESELMSVIDQYDGIIMGDDEYTRDVLAKGKASKLKILSKYGVGLDKVDLDAAKELGVEVRNVLGVNQTTVAEHVFGLLLSFAKNIPEQIAVTRNGEWKRKTGFEIRGKKFGVLGFGKIGKEVAKLAKAFGMNIMVYDITIDDEAKREIGVEVANSVDKLFQTCDVITLHMPLLESTQHIVNADRLGMTKDGFILLNTSRGALVDQDALIDYLETNKSSAYLADVIEVEPIDETCLINKLENVWITPHIGSRTLQNVERQGIGAINNLVEYLKLEKK